MALPLRLAVPLSIVALTACGGTVVECFRPSAAKGARTPLHSRGPMLPLRSRPRARELRPPPPPLCRTRAPRLLLRAMTQRPVALHRSTPYCPHIDDRFPDDARVRFPDRIRIDTRSLDVRRAGRVLRSFALELLVERGAALR
jgi:hypothetical protein